MLKRCLSVLTVCIFISIFLSACWDKHEIEERGFVEIIMVDSAPVESGQQSPESEQHPEDVLGRKKGPMLKVTYVFPNTSLLSGEGAGGGDQPGFSAVSAIAPDISIANRYVDSKVSRRLYFGQTQIAIFGKKLFDDPDTVKRVIDHFRRDPELSRTIKVLIAEGEASKVAEVKPKTEKLLFRYIRGIMDNERTNGRVMDVDLNEFVIALSKAGNATMIPKVQVEGDELSISGLAFMKDYRIAGYLSEYDALYYNTLRGKRSGGRESVDIDGLSVEYVSNNTKRSVRLLNGSPDHIEIGISVDVEGTVIGGEYGTDIFDDGTIKRIEEALDKVANQSCTAVIKKLQRDLNVDALMIGDYLKKFHPSLWDKIKDSWGEVYPDVTITPEISNKVRRIGEVK